MFLIISQISQNPFENDMNDSLRLKKKLESYVNHIITTKGHVELRNVIVDAAGDSHARDKALETCMQ